MLETAVVGGGLCGLALSARLHEQGHDVALFEARARLGGRVLSASCADGSRVDLGPTWFWPSSQPLITRLISELGLESFAQHDQGAVLVLPDPEKPAEVAKAVSVHGGARRVSGGMTSLIEAVAQRLPADRVHAQHVLVSVQRGADHVELEFLHAGERIVVAAQRVVLALPPRLLAEQVAFEPALDTALRAQLLTTPTWMATTAKAVVRYAHAPWRDAGQSGNAFVQHERVVLDEIFDACDATGELAALGGFFALPPEVRRTFQAGMRLLIGSQMVQVFGSGLLEQEQFVQDWASEPFTCSQHDLEDEPALEHPEYGSPLLTSEHWNGQLFFAGSETAGREGGYLEGALEAARRVEQALALPGCSDSVRGAGPGVQA